MKKDNNLSKVIILALVVLDFFVWSEILFFKSPEEEELAFLDVGQGDSILYILPGGAKILTDAGPSRQVINSLEKVVGGDRYIDLAVISHPQLDHFNGFNYLLRNYKFGTILWNGRGVENEEWKVLMSAAEKKNIPLITIGAGDRIKYASNTIEILSPNELYLQSADLNDTSIVEFIKSANFNALLTGDIGFSVENYLAENFDIRADILKVPHHGSKNSSGEAFLRLISPKVAIIQAGAGNRYGHPTKETLERLELMEVFRTDLSGTIRIKAAGDKPLVFTER